MAIRKLSSACCCAWLCKLSPASKSHAIHPASHIHAVRRNMGSWTRVRAGTVPELFGFPKRRTKETGSVTPKRVVFAYRSRLSFGRTQELGLERVRKIAGMKTYVVAAIAVMLLVLGSKTAQSQANASAVRRLEISVFDGVSGVYTGLNGARNVSLTAGVDVGFRPFFGLLPAVEVRGMYPLDGGAVDKQKNALAGLRLEKRRGKLRVYGDALFGRGQIDYLNGGYLNTTGTYRYLSSTSNVFSLGAGLSVDVSRNFSIFAEAQFQRYNTPATASGVLWAKPVTIGVISRLPGMHHGRPY